MHAPRQSPRTRGRVLTLVAFAGGLAGVPAYRGVPRPAPTDLVICGRIWTGDSAVP